MVKMALTNGYSLTEGNGIEMLLEINHQFLTGLRAKLNSSSLPLEARCRLATNAITCRVAVPHRLGEIKHQKKKENARRNSSLLLIRRVARHHAKAQIEIFLVLRALTCTESAHL